MSTSTPTYPSSALPVVIPQIPFRSQAQSFSIAGSEEKTVLKYALNNITPDDLHKILLRSAEALMPTQVEKLNKAIESTGIVLSRWRQVAKDKTARHCLRCHRSYLERDNGLRACIVEHYQPIQGAPVRVPGWMIFPCCGERPKSYCFVGRHTMKTEYINYKVATVKTCEQKKCVNNARKE